MADNLKGIPFSSDDEGIDFPTRAKAIVGHVYNEHFDEEPLTKDEIYVVWFAFVRGNWKAVLSTSRPDGRIYEISYKDGDEVNDHKKIIVDTYVKTNNIVVENYTEE
jgi:uncharacterized protein DUF6275